MIKSLILHNFESHRHSELDFSSGVNIIVGATDSGKTAILRAVKLVAKNRPLGSNMVSWKGISDGTEMFVQFTTDTDTITRSKGKQEEYKLNDIRFHAFKTEVPEEIIKALNMQDVNLKSQFESHFLLSDSSGDVASHFNRIARLDKIDTGTANINKWITKLKSDIEYNNEQIEKKTEELAKFDYLVDFENEVAELEVDKIALELLQAKRGQLDYLIESIETIDAEIIREQQILEIESLLDSILADMSKRKVLASEADKLDALIVSVIQVQQDLDKYETILSIESLVVDLLKLHADKRDAETERTKLSRLIDSITSTAIQLTQAENRYTILHKQFEDEFPEICPLCGKPK